MFILSICLMILCYLFIFSEQIGYLKECTTLVTLNRSIGAKETSNSERRPLFVALNFWEAFQMSTQNMLTFFDFVARMNATTFEPMIRTTNHPNPLYGFGKNGQRLSSLFNFSIIRTSQCIPDFPEFVTFDEFDDQKWGFSERHFVLASDGKETVRDCLLAKERFTKSALFEAATFLFQIHFWCIGRNARTLPLEFFRPDSLVVFSTWRGYGATFRMGWYVDTNRMKFRHQQCNLIPSPSNAVNDQIESILNDNPINWSSVLGVHIRSGKALKKISSLENPQDKAEKWIECIVNTIKNLLAELDSTSVAIISDFHGCPEGCDHGALRILAERSQKIVADAFSDDSFVFRKIAKTAGCQHNITSPDDLVQRTGSCIGASKELSDNFAYLEMLLLGKTSTAVTAGGPTTFGGTICRLVNSHGGNCHVDEVCKPEKLFPAMHGIL